MRAYSTDLRRKIVDAVKRGLTKTEVARTFGVSRSSVKRYVNRDQEFGSLVPSRPPGSSLKIDDRAKTLLQSDLEERPAATLAQRCAYLQEIIGIRVGISTLWRCLRKLGYSHKKRSVGAAERDDFQRAAWQVMVADQVEADRLVFVDEMGSNTSLYPLCAWSPSGERARCSVPRNRGKNTTLIASVTIEGMGPSLAIEGSTDALAFETYIEQCLVPTLQAGQVVVMDNLNAHKGERVRELVEGAGCELLYLPTYSPDLNPLEEAFAKVKAILRKAEARTREVLIEMLSQAISAVTAQDAHGFFKDCGYQLLPSCSPPSAWRCSQSAFRSAYSTSPCSAPSMGSGQSR
jgi:transposase